MEFDPTNSNQNTIKPIHRARFRHATMILPHQESSFPNYCLNSSVPSSSGTQRIKKMKLDPSKSEVIRSVVTGEVSVHNRRSDSNTTLQENRSSKKQLFNMIPSTQTATMSTIEEQSIHNGNRGYNFAEFSQQPSVRIADEETVYSGRRSSGFPSFLKPSTTTAMPGVEEETVYNGKRGGIFLFLNEPMISFKEESDRKGGVRDMEHEMLKQSEQVGSQTKRKTIHEEKHSKTSIQEFSVSNGEANNQTINGVNQASTSRSSQKRRRDIFSETIHVPETSSGQSDGYKWWKYGEKRIKGSPHPRSYYKCKTQKDECLATKQVMKVSDDPSMLEVTYKKRHTHPPLKNSINISPHATSQPDTNHLPAPLENETRVTPHPVFNFDMNVPAPLENEMPVVPHDVSNFDINVPAPLENEMDVMPHEISNFDMNVPAPLENEMHVIPHAVSNFDMNFPAPLENGWM